ncbi:CLUMA_CG015759, isoform A [Clunio marinus]|uniref:CLUMA_CG015759, isoform A n=1 Tax=Clunio marinus TaxID=568069 RepID=A0A1J1IRZ9_9DIPT|nr:CLUMA_CG015759, isoform A [Clunio marinus]
MKAVNIFIIFLVMISCSSLLAFPLPEDDKSDSEYPKISTNLLLQQITNSINQELMKELKNETLKFGDSIDDGNFQIEIESWNSYEAFPFSFNSKDNEIVNEVKVTRIEGDFEDSAEYIIETTIIPDVEASD